MLMGGAFSGSRRLEAQGERFLDRTFRPLSVPIVQLNIVPADGRAAHAFASLVQGERGRGEGDVGLLASLLVISDPRPHSFSDAIPTLAMPASCAAAITRITAPYLALSSPLIAMRPSVWAFSFFSSIATIWS